MPTASRRVPDLLRAALAVTDPAARRALLDRECPTPDQSCERRQVDSLVRIADELAATFGRTPDLSALVADLADFAEPTPSPESPESPPPPDFAGRDWASPLTEADDPLVGTTVAERYEVRSILGEGGMGVVYGAEQVQPVRRPVALKVIRAGMDTRRVLARFEGERQALALMDHPHVARVLDAGSAGPGRPFFVMELVHGVPLTDYCDAHRLSLPERLHLFTEVCQAVQHAHQKGIIHRDLKPTNILVEHRDGRPAPKVIDFGLAKAVDGLRLSDASAGTVFGAVAGTPLYMAPEQATFQATDVDTRADLYALGVILYELLAGSTPLPREAVALLPLDEFLRAVREDEPPPPSQRVGPTASRSLSLSRIAADRRVEPARLRRLLRGELDWIVMQALAKERDRRYTTAVALADDITRYLAHEPVLAGPPSATYRTRKFVRRHRGQVIAAALVGLALVGGIIGTTLGLLAAQGEARAKGQALLGEAAQRQWSEGRLSQITRINSVFTSIFDHIDPDHRHDDDEEDETPRSLTEILSERLERAANLIDGDSIGDPLAVARLQLALGQSQLGLHNFRQAADLLAKCRATFGRLLPPGHPDALLALVGLAYAHREAGQPERAQPLDREAIALVQTHLDPADPTTLTTLSLLDWYTEGDLMRATIPLVEQTLATQGPRLGAGHPQILDLTQTLAMNYLEVDREAEGVALLERIHEAYRTQLGPDHTTTINTLVSLAHGLYHLDQHDKAIPLLERVLDHHRARSGPNHPETIGALRKLANALREAGRLDQAGVVLKEMIPLMIARLGPSHPQTLQALHNEAYLVGLTNPTEAITLFERVLATKQTVLGADHPDTFLTQIGLADVCAQLKRWDQAIALFRQAVAGRRLKLGRDDVATLSAETHLATLLLDADRPAEALAVLQELVPRRLLQSELTEPTTLIDLYNLATAWDRTKQPERAAAVWEQYLAGNRGRYGSDHAETWQALVKLADSWRAADQPERAIPPYQEAVAGRRAGLGVDHPDTLLVANNLALCHLRLSQFDQAIALFEETLKHRRARSGPDHAETLLVLNNLAQAHHDAGRFAQAIPYFAEALQRRRATLSPDHPSTLTSLRGLAAAHRGAGHHDEAAPVAAELVAARRRRPHEATADALALADALSLHGAILLHQQKPGEAEPILREALATRERLQPDQWMTFNTRSLLGGALLDLNRPTEARPLLVDGFQGLKRLQPQIRRPDRPRVAQALDRLIRLAEASGNPAEVQSWRAEQAQLDRSERAPSAAAPDATDRPPERPGSSAGDPGQSREPK